MRHLLRLPLNALLGLTLLGSSLAAQQESIPAMRLADRVGAPLALLSTHASDDVASPSLDPLGRLSDGGLGRIVRLAAHLEPDESATSSWQRVSSLLGLAEGELEIALVALLPQDTGLSLPFLIARVELGERGRLGLSRALETQQFAKRHRTIQCLDAGGKEFAVQTYALDTSERRPGAFFELALVGDQLFVANQASVLKEVLAFSGAEPAEDSFGRDASARRLLDELDGTEVQLIVDWERVRSRLLGLLPPGPSLSLDALGLETATRLAIGVHSAEDGLETCLVVDQPGGPSGLFAAAEKATPKSLSRALVGDSVATAVLDVDFGGLLRAEGPAGYLGFHKHASQCSSSIGLDFEKAVLPNLGRSAACEVHWVGGAGEAGVALSFEARGRRGAAKIQDAAKAAFRAQGLQVESKSVRGLETHRLTERGLSFAARGDRFVIGLDRGVIGAMDQPIERADGKSLSRSDIEDLLKRAMPKSQRTRTSARRTIGAFVLRPGAFEGSFPHAGLLTVDRTLVRLDCFTPDR